jgi:hypothetical protein
MEIPPAAREVDHGKRWPWRTLAVLALIPPSTDAATIQADATVHWTENLSRTSAPANQRDAYGADAHGSAAWFRQIAPNLSATTRTSLTLHATPKYEKRGHAIADLGVDLRYKAGLGPAAPTLRLSGSAGFKHARLDADSGFQTLLQVAADKRVHPALRLGAAIDWNKHDARRATFDVSHRKLSGHASWDVTERWRISHGHARIEGSFTANASGAAWAQALNGQVSPEVQRYYTSVPRQVTEIYGPAWVTYNVTGRARSWWIEVSPALSKSSSLALRYERVAARNIVGIGYDQSIWSVSLAHQF